MPNENQDYLGDGVYAEWTGYSVILKANDHHHPTDTIHLERNELEALKRFYERHSGQTL
jgi:hypothetical protein